MADGVPVPSSSPIEGHSAPTEFGQLGALAAGGVHKAPPAENSLYDLHMPVVVSLDIESPATCRKGASTCVASGTLFLDIVTGLVASVPRERYRKYPGDGMNVCYASLPYVEIETSPRCSRHKTWPTSSRPHDEPEPHSTLLKSTLGLQVMVARHGVR